jgi:predicted nucleotidyltransferase
MSDGQQHEDYRQHLVGDKRSFGLQPGPMVSGITGRPDQQGRMFARRWNKFKKCSYFVSMYTLQHILQILRKHKPELERKYPISRLGVFGSYARGEATEKSDVDIAVEFSAPMGLNFVAMADEIEAMLGIKTDVVPKRAIKSRYLAFVEKDIVYV